jgi:hypothetical protein
MGNCNLTGTILCLEFVIAMMFAVTPSTPCTSNSSVAIECHGEIAYPTSLQPEPESIWLKIVELFLIPLFTGILGCFLGNLALDYAREQRQKRKDGKSRTPVVIRPLHAIEQIQKASSYRKHLIFLE